ncbi:hypothetical protein ES5_10896, partial [Dietzia cinnamea P4]
LDEGSPAAVEALAALDAVLLGARRPRRNSSRAPPTPASASSGRTG